MAQFVWRDTQLPNFSGANDMWRLSAGSFNKGFDGIDKSLGDWGEAQAKIDSGKVMKAALAAQDPEQLKAALASGTFLDGLDPGNISPAAFEMLNNQQGKLLNLDATRASTRGQELSNSLAARTEDDKVAQAGIRTQQDQETLDFNRQYHPQQVTQLTQNNAYDKERYPLLTDSQRMRNKSDKMDLDDKESAAENDPKLLDMEQQAIALERSGNQAGADALRQSQAYKDVLAGSSLSTQEALKTMDPATIRARQQAVTGMGQDARTEYTSKRQFDATAQLNQAKTALLTPDFPSQAAALRGIQEAQDKGAILPETADALRAWAQDPKNAGLWTRGDAAPEGVDGATPTTVVSLADKLRPVQAPPSAFSSASGSPAAGSRPLDQAPVPGMANQPTDPAFRMAGGVIAGGSPQVSSSSPAAAGSRPLDRSPTRAVDAVLGGAARQEANQVWNRDIAAGDTSAVIKRFEGWAPAGKWDVNAYRGGYGSDTITKADGSVVKITQGMPIDRADAERDLARRSAEFASGARSAVGAENWDRLPPAAQAALTSVAYNYGSLPNSVAQAVTRGDLNGIASAVEGLAGHNNGINEKRRMAEADIIRGGTGTGGLPLANAQPTMPQAGMTRPLGPAASAPSPIAPPTLAPDPSPTRPLDNTTQDTSGKALTPDMGEGGKTKSAADTTSDLLKSSSDSLAALSKVGQQITVDSAQTPNENVLKALQDRQKLEAAGDASSIKLPTPKEISDQLNVDQTDVSKYMRELTNPAGPYGLTRDIAAAIIQNAGTKKAYGWFGGREAKDSFADPDGDIYAQAKLFTRDKDSGNRAADAFLGNANNKTVQAKAASQVAAQLTAARSELAQGIASGASPQALATMRDRVRMFDARASNLLANPKRLDATQQNINAIGGTKEQFLKNRQDLEAARQAAALRARAFNPLIDRSLADQAIQGLI